MATLLRSKNKLLPKYTNTDHYDDEDDDVKGSSGKNQNQNQNQQNILLPRLLITPLYAALSPAKQLQAFEPTPKNYRKIVLATNIAETSVTITGIRYVVDSG